MAGSVSSRRTVLKGSAAVAGAVAVGVHPATHGRAVAQTTVDMWVGAVTPSSAWVRGKVDASSVRLVVADDEDFSDPVYLGPVEPSEQGVASVEATDLAADSRYWFAFEVDGELDTGVVGQFRTHPPLGSAASFTFAAASCAGHRLPDRVSNHEVFDTIRTHPSEPLFFAHLGDMHYRDIDSADIGRYRQAYDDVLAQPRQHALYRNVAIVYLWDDHDYGPNDSDRHAPGREQAAAAYRERVPHYPLAASDGAIYQHFQIGRVLFVGTDLRYHRDFESSPPAMLGNEQKAWLGEVLGSSDAAALIWLSTTQWMGTSGDSWPTFAEEQTELIDLLATHGWLDRMVAVYGDKHALGIDTGGGNEVGGFPVFMFASLDAEFGSPEDHYDTGPTQPGRNQYGTVEIDDDGSTITITGTGWQGGDVWRSHTVTVDAPG